MEHVTFKKFSNEQGLITELEIGGKLVLENAKQLKREFTSVVNSLNKQLKIRIVDVSGLDLSFIQLVLAFIILMDDNHVVYEFKWNLDDDLRNLLESVGLSNELFMNN